jgi:aminopeptidase N
MITGERPYPSLLGVTAHELAHAWFQHVLANNEAKHPWMDEGFTEYITSLSEEYVNDSFSDFPHKSSYDRYFMINNFQKGNPDIEIDQPQTVHSDRWNFNFTYGANAYSKGAVFLSQLGYVIGKDILAKTIKRYYNEFKFRHPTPNDFKRVAEKVSDIELEWYLNDWTRTTNKIDYEISSYDKASKRVLLKRKENMPMPLEILATFEDGSKQLYYIPVDLMFGSKKFNKDVVILDSWKWVSSEYSFFISEQEKNLVSLEIDPSKRLADINQDDNFFETAE